MITDFILKLSGETCLSPCLSASVAEPGSNLILTLYFKEVA